ncbi:MAG: hypothetical protein SF029_11190 [bacterium]|nr:hypothetical protein [bacterium]
MPDFARMIDELQYSLIVLIAGVHWGLQKALLMSGYTIKLINNWLIENAFVPIIAQTNDSLRVAVGYVFVVALVVLGITYLLAAFVRLDVVSPRSALMWYVAGALFFTIGPSFYQGMNEFRLNIGQVMYLSVLNGLDDNAGDFSSLAQVTSSDLGLGELCDHLDVYLPGATGPGTIDGLDIALAYLRGHAQDIMGYPQPIYSPGCSIYLQNPNPSTWSGEGGTSVVPMDWNLEGGYFDSANSPITWDEVEEAVRDSAVSMAGASQQRALTAWPLLLFGLIEQIVHLLITIAMGITFISFGMAILFAFFKRTESIAHSLINQWIELIVQTTAISMIQALVIGFFLAGAATGSAPAIIGIGLICLVFIVITMWSGVKAVWNSFNRLFGAMGQVAGGVFVTPGALTSAATTSAAAVATGGASLAVSAGANSLAGMNALYNGATPAQAAGLAFGGSQVLHGVTRTLAHMPGLRGTSLGEAAEQFAEGSVTRQVARHIPIVGRVTGPLVGAKLLTDRDPEKATYDDYGHVIARPMLVPAVGKKLESWTTPLRGRKRKRGEGTADDVDWFEDEEGNLTPTFRPVAPRRMGIFTPVSTVEPQGDTQVERRAEQARQRSDYAAEMNSEEMEQHISEQLRANRPGVGGDLTRFEQVAARLEQSAEAITRAVREQMLLGQLKVTGGGDVASVLGDVVRLTQAERIQQGREAVGGVDHLTVADAIARVVGIKPESSATPPVQQDLTRFGLFADQALQMGISGSQAEQVIREVKSSPENQMTDQTRTVLIEQVRAERNLSYDTAEHEVNHLEHTARLLPNEITAFGMMTVPVPDMDVEVQPHITVEPQVDVHVDVPPSTLANEAGSVQTGQSTSGRSAGGVG